MNLRRRSSLALALGLLVTSSTVFADPPPPPPPPAAPQGEPQPPAKHETPREQAAAVVPQPTPPPSAVPAPTPEEIRRRRVTVTVDSTREGTVLERRTSVKEELGAVVVIPFRAVDSTWEQVCVAPCEVDLDRFSSYRVSSQNGVSSSRAFTLPQRIDALQLHVDAGDLLAHRIGQTLTVGGVSAMIVGGCLLAAASSFSHPNDARIAGGITGGLGVAATAVGVPLTFGTVSHVDVDGSREIARVYNQRGYSVPFLPDIKLSKTFTLTQRGIVF
jgi:hypothetical protein